jgi:hypothetical protein
MTLALGALSAMLVPSAQAMDGFAVTVQRKGNDESLLLKFTIQNDVVARVDTLYREECYHHPVISPDGQYIAFLSADHLSVMNSDGTAVRHLVAQNDFMSWYDRRNNILEWPAGPYIYYRSNATEIWKVDARDPQRHERALTYAKDIQNDKEVSFRKWSASLDMQRSAIQMNMCNNVHLIPSSGTVSDYECDPEGCNIHIAPGGGFVNWFTGTPHDYVEIGSWSGAGKVEYLGRVTLEQMGEWAGRELGSGMDWPSWSTNSDRWMCLQAGLSGSGCMGGRFLKCGANQVLFNWIEDKVLVTTNNSSGGPIACCGDLWVAPPAGTGMAYQDTSGAWISTDAGVSAVRHTGVAPDESARTGRIRVDRQQISIAHEDRQRRLSLHGVDGSLVATGTGRIMIGGLAEGFYILRLHRRKGIREHRVLIRR